MPSNRRFPVFDRSVIPEYIWVDMGVVMLFIYPCLSLLNAPRNIRLIPAISGILFILIAFAIISRPQHTAAIIHRPPISRQRGLGTSLLLLCLLLVGLLFFQTGALHWLIVVAVALVLAAMMAMILKDIRHSWKHRHEIHLTQR